MQEVDKKIGGQVNDMNDLVERLHGEASEYEPDRVEAALFIEAAERIESLEDELAAANEKTADKHETILMARDLAGEPGGLVTLSLVRLLNNALADPARGASI